MANELDGSDAVSQLPEAAEQALEAVGYELSQTDVQALLSLASTLTVELYIVIALLLIVAGLLFGSIATRFWKVG